MTRREKCLQIQPKVEDALKKQPDNPIVKDMKFLVDEVIRLQVLIDRVAGLVSTDENWVHQGQLQEIVTEARS